jgi:hypothetical protein
VENSLVFVVGKGKVLFVRLEKLLNERNVIALEGIEQWQVAIVIF